MQSSAKQRAPLAFVLAAIFWGLNQITAGSTGFTRIVANDLWQFAVLIGSPEPASVEER